ncbi:MAG: type II secretion system F family protein [Phycisphaerales bacterium]
MPNFEYTAITVTGQRVAGMLTGGSEQAVLAELESRRLTPVRIEPAKERRSTSRRVSTRQLAQAYQQLADLLRAGVPLLRGLKLLGAQKSCPPLAKTFAQIADDVAEGVELASALESRSDTFPRVHVAMVRAGEKGGFLEGVLGRLAQFLSAQAELRSKVIGNLIYPAILIVSGVVVLGLIFGYFLPQFRPIFAKVPLNSLTRGVLAISDFIAAYGIYLVGVVAGLGIGAWSIRNRPQVRERTDRWMVRGPVIGPITRTLGVARFCRILGTLLGNGIPMISAMQIARDAAGNRLMESAIEAATESVRHGEALAAPLAKSGLFAEDVIEMISVGESANNLDDVLVTIADTMERRLDRQLTAAVKLIEPAMLLVLAIIVAIVALSVILPMTQLSSNIGG